MLKTLELLTDHCKVSRIFNNLHVTRSPSIFGAGQAASPGSLRQGSQKKPLLHSSLQRRNGLETVLNTEVPGPPLSTAKPLISPSWSGGLGWLGGLLAFEGQQKPPDPLLELSLEQGRRKGSTAPAWRQSHPDIAVLCRGFLGQTLPGNRSGAGRSKMLPDQGGRQLRLLCSCPTSIPSTAEGGAVKGLRRKDPSNQRSPCLWSLLHGMECTFSQTS